MMIFFAAYLCGVAAAFGSCLARRETDWKDIAKMSALSWVAFGFLVCDLIADLKH
jgi:hypothetical protein